MTVYAFFLTHNEICLGLLTPGLLYDYVSISCAGGEITPKLPPLPDPYPVNSPVNIPWCIAASEQVLSRKRGYIPISEVYHNFTIFLEDLFHTTRMRQIIRNVL